MIDFNEVRPFGSVAQRVDLDAVIARLRDSAEDWAPRLFPSGRRSGKDWRIANIRGDAPGKHGSCAITLQGPHAGDWYEFESNEGGGVLGTIGHATNLRGRFLIEFAAELAGISDGKLAKAKPAPRPAKSPEAKNNDIKFILSACLPTKDTFVDTYLASRGLSLPTTPDVLFHPDLAHWETKMGYPAMVAIVRDTQGAIIGLHRTWLTPDGSGKADIPKPKMMLGPVAGGAVHLSENIVEVVGIAEGIETALAVQQACPQLPVWAALSTSGMERIVLPPTVRRVVLLADNDKSGAGFKAAEAAATRLIAEGRRAWIVLPFKEGEDFNDLLQNEGSEAIRAELDKAAEFLPQAEESIEPESAEEIHHLPHKPFGFTETRGIKPQLHADDGDLARVADQCWSILYASNHPPWLFRLSLRLVWIDLDDEGCPKPQFITEDRMKYVLARQIDWRRQGKDNLIPAHPPGAAIKDILATPHTLLPVLGGIVATPVFGPDGKLIASPGYHETSKLMYVPRNDFVLPQIPARPSSLDIKTAREFLLGDLLGDFPFTGEAERAHALGLLLLPFMRPMIDGPTPIHLIEKPTPGTGATLMVDAVAEITTGARANIMTEGRDEDEWRKRLTSALRAMPTLTLIDNLRGRLDSAALAAAITAPAWEDRILGKSELVSLPVRCAWIVTGNNPALSNEMARRSIRIRLDARVDQPWRRDGFRHADLICWVKANRPQLVASCLTLGQAWIAAGKPAPSQSIGSFESWAQVIGGVLMVADIAGFLTNLDDLYEASDAEGTLWRGFVIAWWERFLTHEVGVGDLYQLAEDRQITLPLGDGNDRSRRIRLGKHLARMRDRTFQLEDGLSARIVSSGVRHQAQTWHLAPNEKSDLGKHSPHSPLAAQEGECLAVLGQHSPQHSPLFCVENHDIGESGECGEYKSTPYAYARAHAHARYETNPEKHSPHSPHPPTVSNTKTFAGECSVECQNGHSPAMPTPPRPWPPWLEGMQEDFSSGMVGRIAGCPPEDGPS